MVYISAFKSCAFKLDVGRAQIEAMMYFPGLVLPDTLWAWILLYILQPCDLVYVHLSDA